MTRAKKAAVIAGDDFVIPEEHRALGLRSVDKNHQAYGKFQWPKNVGDVCVAPDWEPVAECGGGLHVIPDGWGNWDLMSFDEGSAYKVVEYVWYCVRDGKLVAA